MVDTTSTTARETPASDLSEAGAPEIEITEEMEAAGIGVLVSFETSMADEAYWARKVYLAMETAKGRT